MSGLERTTYTVGEGFNPDSAKHQSKLLEAVAKEHGEGFEIESYDPASQSVSLTRRSALTTVVSHADSEALKVNLAGQVRDADAERYSVSLTDTYPGYVMTSFEPHRKQAILAKLSDEVILARDTLSNALRVRPWEIQVSKNGSGFSFSLPPTYMPSKHDEKLAEAAEMVGEPGWYVETDIRSRSGRIVKAEPPTFEGIYPTPMDTVEHFDHTKKSHYKIPLGIRLPQAGGSHTPFELDLNASPHTQLGGTSGSGKSVVLNAYIYHWLNRGAQMALIDTPVKSVDFMWCRDFLMESGWGCDSTFHAAATSQMIIDLYKARSSQMQREGYQNFKDIPAGKGFAPVVLVIDEVSNLFQTTEVPKANQDSPEKLQQMKADAEAENFATNVLKKNITRIAADARFAGVFLLLSTQIATQNTGIGTDLRTNLGHKALMGVGPTDRQRANVFSDADSVPKVPENIKADADAAKGVGAFDPEGARPTVFKSYFATIDDYRQRLDEAGVVTRENVRPPASEVIEIFGEETIPDDVQL